MLTFGTIKITYPNLGNCPILVNDKEQHTIADFLEKFEGLFGLSDADSTLPADSIELGDKVPDNLKGTCRIRLDAPDTLVIEKG